MLIVFKNTKTQNTFVHIQGIVSAYTVERECKHLYIRT